MQLLLFPDQANKTDINFDDWRRELLRLQRTLNPKLKWDAHLRHQHHYEAGHTPLETIRQEQDPSQPRQTTS